MSLALPRRFTRCGTTSATLLSGQTISPTPNVATIETGLGVGSSPIICSVSQL